MQVICTSLQSDNHDSNSSLNFFMGQMFFLSPNQQHQSTEGTTYSTILSTKSFVPCKYWVPNFYNVPLVNCITTYNKQFIYHIRVWFTFLETQGGQKLLVSVSRWNDVQLQKKTRKNCPQSRLTDHISLTNNFDLDLWPWPSIPCKLQSWPTHVKKFKVNGHVGQSVTKTEWKQADGRTEATALPAGLTQSVITSDETDVAMAQRNFSANQLKMSLPVYFVNLSSTCTCQHLFKSALQTCSKHVLLWS